MSAQSEDRRLRHQKRAQAVMSYGAAATGLGALGLKGASVAVKGGRVKLPPRIKLKPRKVSRKLDNASVGTLTVGAGLGGVSSINFADMQNQEAKRLKVRKADIAKRRILGRYLAGIAEETTRAGGGAARAEFNAGIDDASRAAVKTARKITLIGATGVAGGMTAGTAGSTYAKKKINAKKVKVKKGLPSSLRATDKAKIVFKPAKSDYIRQRQTAAAMGSPRHQQSVSRRAGRKAKAIAATQDLIDAGPNSTIRSGKWDRPVWAQKMPPAQIGANVASETRANMSAAGKAMRKESRKTLKKNPKQQTPVSGRPPRQTPVTKGLPSHGYLPGKGRVRVLNQHSKDHFMVLTDRDERVLAPRARITFTKPPKPKKPKPPGGTVAKSAFGVEHSVSKAYDPEERRQKRSGMAIGGLAAASAASGAGAGATAGKAKKISLKSKKEYLAGMNSVDEAGKRASKLKDLSGASAKSTSLSASKDIGQGLKNFKDSAYSAHNARKLYGRSGKLALVSAGSAGGAYAVNRKANRSGRKYKQRWNS